MKGLKNYGQYDKLTQKEYKKLLVKEKNEFFTQLSKPKNKQIFENENDIEREK